MNQKTENFFGVEYSTSGVYRKASEIKCAITSLGAKTSINSMKYNTKKIRLVKLNK